MNWYEIIHLNCSKTTKKTNPKKNKQKCQGRKINSIPFPFQADPYYQIIYFLHSMCQYLLGVIFGNASVIWASIVIIASGQFDMLLCSLKNVQATAMTFNGSRLEQLRLALISSSDYNFKATLFICLLVFLYRKLQSLVDFKSEELNQYYLAAELMDDVELNTEKMRAALKRDPNKFQPSKKYAPQDNYLTDLTEELNHAIFACIQHHQMLIEFSAMMEDFFSLFVLLKSFQCTFQICNLVFTFIKVRMIKCCEYSLIDLQKIRTKENRLKN